MTFHARKNTMTLGKWFAAAGAAVALGLAQPALAADYVIRLSHGMPELLSSGQHAWALIFKETAEARSAGKIEVRILGNNAAGNERQLIKRIVGAQGQPHTTITGGGHFLQEDRGPQLAQVVIDLVARR